MTEHDICTALTAILSGNIAAYPPTLTPPPGHTIERALYDVAQLKRSHVFEVIEHQRHHDAERSHEAQLAALERLFGLAKTWRESLRPSSGLDYGHARDGLVVAIDTHGRKSA